jgi:CRISPR-associated protein Cas5d
MPSTIKLHVWGDHACFTRPEMKAERVSYDVITPSAARGILEAIYWKPQIRWVIDRIHVLKPIRFTSFRRNEVGKKMPAPDAKMMRGEKDTPAILIEDERQQRASLILSNVAYLIEARFDLLDRRFEKNGPEMPANEAAGKHLEMFNRRARKGQYFHHPYFGTREFPVSFALIESETDVPTPHQELAGEKDLGFMLHDIEFDQDARSKKVKSTTPRFYPAKMLNGVIDVIACLKDSPLSH